MYTRLKLWPLNFFAIIAVIVSFGIYKSLVFDINCTGHLKLAADSNTVEIAKKQLEIALQYLENKKLTSGNTSIFWSTPENDLDFWFKNLKSSYEELDKITAETSQLERTNVLMKLRETLLDHGTDGDVVTLPSGISVYPYQGVWFFLGILVVILGITGVVLLFILN